MVLQGKMSLKGGDILRVLFVALINVTKSRVIYK